MCRLEKSNLVRLCKHHNGALRLNQIKNQKILPAGERIFHFSTCIQQLVPQEIRDRKQAEISDHIACSVP